MPVLALLKHGCSWCRLQGETVEVPFVARSGLFEDVLVLRRLSVNDIIIAVNTDCQLVSYSYAFERRMYIYLDN